MMFSIVNSRIFLRSQSWSKSENYLSVNISSDLTRKDQSIDATEFRVPFVKQVLHAAAGLEVLMEAPAERCVDLVVARDLLSLETRDVI